MPKADNYTQDEILSEWGNASPLNRRVFYALWYTDARVQYFSGGSWRHETALTCNDEPNQYRIHRDDEHLVPTTVTFPWETPAPAPAPAPERIIDGAHGTVWRITEHLEPDYIGAVVMKTVCGIVTLNSSPCGRPARGDGWSGATTMKGVRLNFALEGIEP